MCVGIALFIIPGRQTFSAIRSDTTKRIAVFPFAASQLFRNDARQIRGNVIRIFEQEGRYRLMSDDVMNATLAEIGFKKLQDCTTPSCASYFGKLLRVDAVLQGRVERTSDSIRLHLQFVKTEDSEILYQTVISSTGSLEDLPLNDLKGLRDGLANVQFEKEAGTRWYVVGGTIIGLGTIVYFISKGLGAFGKEENRFERTPNDPRPPTDN